LGQAEIAATGGAGRRSAKFADRPINQSCEVHHFAGDYYPLANDASGRTWARWRVPYQPVVVLVDRHGRVAERFDGGTTGGTLAAALTYLLGE
jgi:hypothetical protein